MLSHFLSPPTQPNSFPGTMLDWLRSKNQQHLDWIPIGKLMITKIQISSSWLILMYVWSQSLSRWSLARLHTKGSIMFGLQAFLQQQHTSFMRIFLGSHQSIGAALRATCISQKHLPITTRLEISHKNSENKAWKMNSGMVWDASWEFSKWEMSLCFCIFSLMRCWYEEPRRRNKVTVSTWNSEASLKSQLAGCQASRGRPAAVSHYVNAHRYHYVLLIFGSQRKMNTTETTKVALHPSAGLTKFLPSHDLKKIAGQQKRQSSREALK